MVYHTIVIITLWDMDPVSKGPKKAWMIQTKSISDRSSISNGRTIAPTTKSSINRKCRGLGLSSPGLTSCGQDMPPKCLQDSYRISFPTSLSIANNIADPQNADSKTNWSLLPSKLESAIIPGKQKPLSVYPGEGQFILAFYTFEERRLKGK